MISPKFVFNHFIEKLDLLTFIVTITKSKYTFEHLGVPRHTSTPRNYDYNNDTYSHVDVYLHKCRYVHFKRTYQQEILTRSNKICEEVIKI